MLQTNLLKDLSNTVTNCRSRSQRQIHDAKLNTKASGSLLCYQLTNTCYLEGSTLDHLTKSFKILTSYLFQRSLNNARSADTNINDSVCFCHTMESTCHKRVIIRCITEYNQLRTSQGILIFGSFRCFQNDLTHQLNSIHIDTCTCRSNIYRTADTLCLRHSLWDRFDQKSLSRSHSLAYQCRITADKVYAYHLGSLIQSFCNSYKIFLCLTCSSANQCDRSYGNSFIYDRNSIFTGNSLTCRYQILCTGCDLFIDFLI